MLHNYFFAAYVESLLNCGGFNLKKKKLLWWSPCGFLLIILKRWLSLLIVEQARKKRTFYFEQNLKFNLDKIF